MVCPDHRVHYKSESTLVPPDARDMKREDSSFRPPQLCPLQLCPPQLSFILTVDTHSTYESLRISNPDEAPGKQCHILALLLLLNHVYNNVHL